MYGVMSLQVSSGILSIVSRVKRKPTVVLSPMELIPLEVIENIFNDYELNGKI